jgi:hypothetical protein
MDDPLILLMVALGVFVIYEVIQQSQSGGGSGMPGSSGTSMISQIVAQLESGGGTNVANQPEGMVNPTYGQYAGFATQYGQGAAGVDNFAQQVLSFNPNATLGDFYASYVLSTGNPANLSSASQLAAQYPSAYNNMVNNSGVSINTPLSQLV